MLSVNVLCLTFIVYFMYHLIKTKPTQFTLALISLISFSILIGSIEYILLILATTQGTPTPYPFAYSFIFGECLEGITILSDLQEFLQWLSALILGMKYHSVARQIEAVLKNGSLIPNSEMRFLRLSYTILIFCCLAFLVTLIMLTEKYIR